MEAVNKFSAVDLDKTIILKILDNGDIANDFWQSVFDDSEYDEIVQKLGNDAIINSLIQKVSDGYAKLVLNLPCVKVIFDK